MSCLHAWMSAEKLLRPTLKHFIFWADGDERMHACMDGWTGVNERMDAGADEWTA